jgi:CheY-like chemotaxis protein
MTVLGTSAQTVPGSAECRASQDKHPALSSASSRSLKILLAEDNPINQCVETAFLESMGHTVVIAGNGNEALAALEREYFDLVIMDVQMPEMDGLQATNAIREKEKMTGGHIPIIAMTAHVMKGDRERCLEAGMDSYVSKPINRAELFASIAALTPLHDTSAEDSKAELTSGNEHSQLDRAVSFDRSAALSGLHGNVELLKEISAMFLAQYNQHLTVIREAIGKGDGVALQRAAHTLKGAVGNFSARSVQEAAYKLELIGRSGRLVQAEDAFNILQAEIMRLKPELELIAGER